MENSTKNQENKNISSMIPSPKSYSSNSSTSSTSSTTHSNGFHPHHHLPPPPTPPPRTPIPVTRSEPNSPYPTTFVQADTSSFKQVVQMLTGSSETAKHVASTTRSEPFKNPIPPIKAIPKKEKSASRLYERRNSLKDFKISPLGPGLVYNKKHVFASGSPRPATPEILSPSILDFPSLVLSPVTPLIPDPFNRGAANGKKDLDMEAENKAIAQKGFFLHPSPANTPRDSEPRLLPLFPVTSPRLSGSDESNS